MEPKKSTVVDPTAPVVPVGTDEGSDVSQETIAQGSLDAAELAKRLEAAELRANQLEADRRKQQSVLQQQAAKQKVEFEARIADTQEKLKGKLSETERTQYELEQVKLQLANLQAERESIQQQLEQQKQTSEWVNYFSNQFDVDPSEIDTSSQEAMLTSAMAAAAVKYQSVKGGNQTQPTKPQTKVNAPARPAPGQTVTGNGQPPAGKPTIFDIQKQVSANMQRNVTLDELFKMAEAGQVDFSQIS
jgi:vacuolar-type H+-ATPase subunit I/STV1